jgi:hypothetical protein
MLVLNVRNVHQALPKGLWTLKAWGKRTPSRNGECITATLPVTTVYQQPLERVLFHPERNANPFFHLFESLWMLSGCNDVQYVEFFNSRMREFSDDGWTFHGAYGYRWRWQWQRDQLKILIALLRAEPNTRRAVLQIWDPVADLHPTEAGKDLPCNQQCFFRVREGRLDMTVTCRSNDIIWGAYGANAVHFSFLHEYVALQMGVVVGKMYQVSNDFHAYSDLFDELAEKIGEDSDPFRKLPQCPYSAGEVSAELPLIVEPGKFDLRLGMFIAWSRALINKFPNVGEDVVGQPFSEPFLDYVAVPAFLAYLAQKDRTKQDRYARAITLASTITATDWRKACVEWLQRRQAKAV